MDQQTTQGRKRPERNFPPGVGNMSQRNPIFAAAMLRMLRLKSSEDDMMHQLFFPGWWISMKHVPHCYMHVYPIKHLDGQMPDGRIALMHYAYGDGDGLMPPFEGWFENFKVNRWSNQDQKIIQEDVYYGVNPVAWRLPIQNLTQRE